MHCVFLSLNGGVEEWCHHMPQHSTVSLGSLGSEGVVGQQELMTCPVMSGWLQGPQKPPVKAWGASKECPLITREKKAWKVLLDPQASRKDQRHGTVSVPPDLGWERGSHIKVTQGGLLGLWGHRAVVWKGVGVKCLWWGPGARRVPFPHFDLQNWFQ